MYFMLFAILATDSRAHESCRNNRQFNGPPLESQLIPLYSTQNLGGLAQSLGISLSSARRINRLLGYMPIALAIVHVAAATTGRKSLSVLKILLCPRILFLITGSISGQPLQSHMISKLPSQLQS